MTLPDGELGVTGNERLTALAGAVLLALIVGELSSCRPSAHGLTGMPAGRLSY
jgi:hypothetical protein